MCRAVWVVIAAPNEEDCRRLRRASGPDVQVVAMATAAAEALAALRTGPADALVVDGRLEGAAALVESAGNLGARPAVLWIGAGAPAAADHVLDPDGAGDALASGITRALIARRRS